MYNIRMLNEEMLILNTENYNKLYEKYKDTFRNRYFIDVSINKNILKVTLPYNIEEVYYKYIKDSKKEDGLTMMLQGCTIKNLNSNSIEIEIINNKNIELNKTFDITNTDIGRFDYNILEDIDIKGIYYNVMMVVDELTINFYTHNKDLEEEYIKIYGVNVSNTENIINEIKKGKYIFLCDTAEDIVKVLEIMKQSALKHFIVIHNSIVKTVGNIRDIKKELLGLTKTEKQYIRKKVQEWK